MRIDDSIEAKKDYDLIRLPENIFLEKELPT